MGHTSIEQLEATVAKGDHDRLELITVLGELGFRNSKRAYELKSLVQRLLGNLETDPPG